MFSLFLKENNKNNNYKKILYNSKERNFYFNNNKVKIINDKKIKILYFTISFGMECNYNCSYCMQQPYRNNKKIFYKENLIEKIKNFVQNIPYDLINFRLWGGEPLLHYSLMKKIVKDIKYYFPISKISFCTNGSLINEEIAQWIEDNNISVALSYDGPGQMYRNKNNIMNSKIYNILKYTLSKKELPWVISTIFHCYNPSTEKFLNHMEKLFPNIDIKYSELNYIKIDNENTLKYNFSEEDLKKDLKYRIDCIKNNIINGYTNFVENKLQYSLQFLDSKEPWCRCYCYYDNYFCVDIEGNFFSCHNTVGDFNKSCGNIFQEYKKPQQIIHDNFFKKYCDNCILSCVCGGGCCEISEKYKLINCKNQYYEHFPLFYSLVNKISNNYFLINYEEI